MKRLGWLVFVRAAALVALAASAALLVDYLRPAPAFCGVGSGCAHVRASSLSSVGPVPVPALGLAAFVTLLAVSLLPGARAAKATRALAVVGGAVGAALLAVQIFVIGALCSLCAVVDGSIVLAAVVVLASLKRAAGEGSRTRREIAAWLAGGAIALASPFAWSALHPAPRVPVEISSLWVEGKLNVVELADFQCPFCRALHPDLAKVLAEHERDVHFVRLMMPLASHAQARDAARLYVCADEQGKAAPMADLLFTAESIGASDAEALGARAGLDLAKLRACLASERPGARVDAEVARVRKAGFEGLPTVWIGDEKLLGLRPEADVRAAFARAERHAPR